jgi:Ca2+-binding RTX toxin-like protein
LHNITGGAGNDIVTLSAVGTTGAQTVAGGTGTDTLNMTLNGTTFSMASVSAVENINLTLGNNSDHSPGTAVNGFNTADLVNITLDGGNTLSTFTAGTAIGSGAGFKTFNASALTGVVDVTIDAAGMDVGKTISGGSASTDVVRYADAGGVNGAVTLSGFEKLVVTTSAASGISLLNATGLTSVEVNGTHDYAITDLAAGVTIGVGNAALALSDTKGVSVTLASATGSADALTFNLTKTGGATGTTLTANGVETLNLNQSTSVAATAMGLSIRDTNTNAVNINLTGGIAGAIGGVQDVTFVSSGLESNVASINASTFAGNMIMADGSRTGTAAMTITGGSGIDTIIMKQVNDVLNGGTGVDTLKIVQNAILGGFMVDLSSTTDQILTYNGASSNSIQVGFENVDLSGVTGGFGADITARSGGSTIVGTLNSDQVTGGAGIDTINGGAGSDFITAGDGADVITGGAGADTLTGGGGADVFRFETVATITGAAGINVDTITDFTTTSDKINFGTAGSGAGATIPGLTLVPGQTTAAAFAAGVADATPVATVADVYTAIGNNAAFSQNANFAGSAATASGIVAKTITFANGAAAGQYLVVNDSTAAFQAANDIVVRIVGTVAAGDLSFTV